MAKLNINQAMELDYTTSEAIKILRTNLEHRGDVRVLCFTSVMGKEGKSFISLHLAKAMAATGKSCVVINGNLREKGRDKGFSRDKDIKGLADYLEDGLTPDDVLCETNIPNLSIIESGKETSYASEVLGKDAYKKLIAKLREGYDHILIDTPTIGEVADGLILAKSSDGVVLVIEPYVVNYEKAQKVKGLLEVNGCNILGVVMNKG